MFTYNCIFFDDVDLLGIEPAQATVIWDLISAFRALVEQAKSEKGRVSSGTARKLELELFYVLQRHYTGEERRRRAMSSSVGKVYHDLRYRLQMLFDEPKEKFLTSDGFENSSHFSYLDFSKFVVTVLADTKSKAQACEEIGLNKSTASRSLSTSTLEKIVNSNVYSLGLISGLDTKDALANPDVLIFDRLQPLTVRELHCCALGSIVGQKIATESTTIFDSSYLQISDVKRLVAKKMAEVTNVDINSNESLSAFGGLCSQATFATTNPEFFLFERSRISNDSSNEVLESLSLRPLSWDQELRNFHCGSLLTPVQARRNTCNVLEPRDEQTRNRLDSYIHSMLDSDKDETANILAQINWSSAWKRLMEGVVDESREKNNLVLRQHAMLTRGLLEIMMQVAYRMYVDAPDGIARDEKVNAAVSKMKYYKDEMNRIAENEENSNTIPDFVNADILFHMAIPLILEKEAQQFLPVSAKEMERFLNQSLLGRNILRFKTSEGRKKIVTEHQAILDCVIGYLSGVSDNSQNVQETGSRGKPRKSRGAENNLVSLNKMAKTLGKHLFSAIHAESDSEANGQISKNMKQLRETALMFNLMISESFGFDPIDLWEKGEIDRLIFLSDCYPPQELKRFRSNATSSESEHEDKEIMLQQIRLILAIKKAIEKQKNSISDNPDLPLTSIAIFVPKKATIDGLVKRKLLSSDMLKKAYGTDRFDCEAYVEAFKNDVRKLFKRFEKDPAYLESLQGDSAAWTDISNQIKKITGSSDNAKQTDSLTLERILESIRFFELTPRIHRRFIVEPGGTIAWHFQENNLVYTYRQDGDERATRVVDTRGDRRYEIFDLLYSIVNGAGKSAIGKLKRVVHAGNDQFENDAPEKLLEVILSIVSFKQSPTKNETHVALSSKQKIFQPKAMNQSVNYPATAAASIVFLLFPWVQDPDILRDLHDAFAYYLALA